MDRKKFLSLSLLGSGTILFPKSSKQQQQKPPPLDKDAIKQFVGAGHGDLEKVKSMLQQQPGLLNASWDWGGGDFESALEGAGHMGRKDIANFLIENGARMNIFCAAMLGKLEIVKSVLNTFPELKTSKGPHGIQLIQHATKGGDEAKAVLDYLKSIGAQ